MRYRLKSAFYCFLPALNTVKFLSGSCGNIAVQFLSLKTYFALDKSLERLSSGYRINRAADDAAGMACYSNGIICIVHRIRHRNQLNRIVA